MARNHDSLMSRPRLRLQQRSMRLEESEWRENMRDFGLMISGIYQDLRGDAHETWRHFSGWIKDSLKKQPPAQKK